MNALPSQPRLCVACRSVPGVFSCDHVVAPAGPGRPLGTGPTVGALRTRFADIKAGRSINTQKGGCTFPAGCKRNPKRGTQRCPAHPLEAGP